VGLPTPQLTSEPLGNQGGVFHDQITPRRSWHSTPATRFYLKRGRSQIQELSALGVDER
jgi:hypothetical protein